MNRHGLWFDEAYTARVAALDWPRLLDGAQRDIHPPGWPLLAGLMLRFPLTPEWALRLPAAICFAALVVLVGMRNVWGGVALLLYGPLVEQAGQARPYVPLALGLAAIVGLAERGHWRRAGIVVAGVASLHALGGPLGGVTLLAAAAVRRPRWRDVGWSVGVPVILSAWWLPAFVRSAASYAAAPWYGRSTPADWWIVTDAGGGAVVVALLIGAAAVGRASRGLAPAVAVLTMLACMDLLGIGVEIRKTGIVVLPLLLTELTASRHGRLAALASVAVLGVTSVRIPDRPDLREAGRAISALDRPLPVVSVFASEAAWYIRSPAPLPSYREPTAIAARIREVIELDEAGCIVAVSLPGTFPSPEDLPSGTRTVLEAGVTGLDVRVVGTEGCDVQATSQQWRPAATP